MVDKMHVEEVEVPEGVTVSVDGLVISVKGPKGEVSRTFRLPGISFAVEDSKVVVRASRWSKREKSLVFTIRAHLRNMFKGVQEPHVYKLKICSGHFPMNVSVSGDKFSVKNFLGEKIPRVLKIKEGASVKLDNQEVTVESPDIELAGQVAADIEQLCRITNRDIRIFQDGIYIIKKPRDE